MKKRMLGLLTALALCLSLLPGTALAEGDPGVIINSTPLESGKQYVAGEYGVIEKPADAPADTPYLDYRDGVLTVHGQMDLGNYGPRIDGAVTFTGGGDSCLETGSIYFNNGTLTLSGSMDFKPKSLSGNYSASQAVSKLTTTDDYSGDIAIGSSYSVVLDVKNSASISIGGNVSYSSSNTPADPITLKSAGDISTNMLQYHTITIEGKNVSLMNSPVFTGKSLTVKAAENVTVPNCAVLFLSGNYTEAVSVDISAGGNVEITNNGILMQAPPDGRNDSLTIRDAKSVSIQGKTNEYNPSLLPVSVTFVNCGSVTVTDTGNGEILKEGVPVTSDCPWTATAGGKTVTIPSGTWTNGGALTPYGTHFIDSSVTAPTAYRAGEGWAFYTPGDTDTPAKLTLDGASYNGTLNIQQAASVQLELKGKNEVESVNAKTMTLTGNGSFQGKLETGAFTNSSTATLNGVVIVSVPREGAGTAMFVGQTVYGNWSASDLYGGQGIVQEDAPITITSGATLTVPQGGLFAIVDLESLTNHGTIINEGDIQILLTEKPQGTPNLGTIVNDGTIVIEVAKDSSGEGIPAFIKALNLTGGGSVVTQYWDGVAGTSVPIATYTNSGVKLLEPAGKPDLSAVIPTEEENAETWNTYGYKWEVLEKEDDTNKIRKATLTLAEGFNAEEVILPGDGAEVTVKTEGDSLIGELKYKGADASTSIKLTFEGGKLAVAEHINFSGDVASSVTIANGAVVEANKGITVSAAAGVDGTVTVNGTLTARGERGGAAVLTGKVSVGPSGKLEVYGETGVFLGGKSTDDVNKTDFTDAFVLSPGGRFTGSCEIDIIAAQRNNGGKIEESLRAEDAIVIPNGYLPQGLAPVFNGERTKLSIPGGGGAFTISSDNVPTPPTPSHRHKWAEGWTTSATHHWHNCTASGCPVTADSEKNGYGQHAYDGGWDADCNVCGYTRSLSSSDSSGSSGSSSHGGGGGSRPTSPITVEPSEHGTVTSDRSGAVYGGPVTLTVRPDSGYELESLTVTDRQGNKMKLSALGGGKYAFTMPGGPVTVRAAFTALEEENCPSRAFSDLDTGAWYHEAVDYVLSEGLMNGYAGGTFRPNSALTRAQFAQILYNKEGRPAGAGSAPFTDVAPDAWCAPAIAWAAERGIAGGYGNGTFGPDDPITREQLAVMLWRYAGSPAAPGGELSFIDAEQIGAHAREAICWAVESGVMSGKAGGVLDPKGFATRAQTAQMLRNFLEQE